MAEKPETAAKERFHRIHRLLRDRICLLEYQPGERLGEEDLAAEFGTSRTPVRRVLGRLEAEGLIERRHGVGTIVTDVDRNMLNQVVQLRLEIASLMGRLAPMNCGQEQLECMGRFLADCRELMKTPDHARFARLQMDFDLELFSMIGNVPLREITERLYFQTTRIWIRSILELDDLDHEISELERKITDVKAALEVKDYIAVGDLYRSHITKSFVQLQQQQNLLDGEFKVHLA